jgi:hypothetical protein
LLPQRYCNFPNDPKYFLKYSMRIPIISQIMLIFARKIESYINKEEFDRKIRNIEEQDSQ